MTKITREGFALPATLLALVVISALATGALFSAAQHDRGSANSQFGHYAFLAAERGLDSVFGTWIRSDFETNLPSVGTVTTLGPVNVTIDDIQAEYTVEIKRLSDLIYLAESEGEILSGGHFAGSKRRLAQIVRLRDPNLLKDRALTAHGPLRMRGTSFVTGQDQIPTGWTGCTDDGLKTSVVAKDLALIDLKNNNEYGGTRQDATLTDNSFLQQGDLKLDDLKAMAQIVYTPPTGSVENLPNTAPVIDGTGACDRSNIYNWGAPGSPSHPCHLYWPIIYTNGSLKMTGGTGQGILIVEGDLEVAGNVEFSGIVFVYGTMKSTGTGSKFTGTVSVLDSDNIGDSDISKGSGNSEIYRSTCAIERAFTYNDRFARPIPLFQRSFVDLSGLGVN